VLDCGHSPGSVTRMTRPVTWLMACLVLATAGGALVRSQPGAGAVRPADARQTGASAYVGAARCAECHRDKHRTWSGARHSMMLQPASPATVAGDFTQATVTLRGTTFALGQEGERFVVRGPFPTAAPATHRVDYTLGSRRVQHYLTTLPDGRIVVLPPTWDVETREWFHNLDIVNPNQPAGIPVQVWNRNCFGCHVSAQVKGFDAQADTYATTWTDFGTNCERCHGPGAAHAARYASPAAAPAVGAHAIVVPTDLPKERATAVCAQCHSLRDLTVPGFEAGAEYFDHFTPVLEYGDEHRVDPAYWADGRPRRFSNDAIGLWQSRCYLEGGATCTTCHVDPHEPNIERNPQLGRTNNGLCTRCHEPIAADVAAHTRHASGSAGSSCVACHMPPTVISLRSRMPDHTLSVPAPENTVTHGIPNACTECHADQGAEWAVKALAEWYPEGRRRALVRRADAFSLGRKRDPAGLAPLVAISRDRDEPPLVRANAVGYLRFYPGPQAHAAIAQAVVSEHAAMRVAAVLGLAERPDEAARARPMLVNALGDPARVVRVSAMLGLTNMQVATLPAAKAPFFEEARRDYLARAALLSDDGRVELDTGKFHLLSRNPDAAVSSLEASLRLEPDLHAARYFLGLARLAQGNAAEARRQLQLVPAENEYAAAAARVLATLPGGTRGRGRGAGS